MNTPDPLTDTSRLTLFPHARWALWDDPVIQAALADADLTVTVRTWYRHWENRRLPLRREDV